MNECLHSVVVAVVATRHDVSAFNFSTLFFCIVRLTWAGGSWRGLKGIGREGGGQGIGAGRSLGKASAGNYFAFNCL